MKINARIAQGQSYRLLTAIFLHANTYHLFTNSYSLAQIGPQVSMTGQRKLLAFTLDYLFFDRLNECLAPRLCLPYIWDLEWQQILAHSLLAVLLSRSERQPPRLAF